MSSTVETLMSKFTSLCSRARLPVFVTLLLFGFSNTILANTLVLCFGSDGHIAVETAHYKSSEHVKKTNTSAARSDNKSKVSFVRTLQIYDNCSDWKISASSLRHIEYKSKQIVLDETETPSFDTENTLLLAAIRNDDFINEVRSSWIRYNKTHPFPTLDTLKSVKLRL